MSVRGFPETPEPAGPGLAPPPASPGPSNGHPPERAMSGGPVPDPPGPRGRPARGDDPFGPPGPDLDPFGPPGFDRPGYESPGWDPPARTPDPDAQANIPAPSPVPPDPGVPPGAGVPGAPGPRPGPVPPDPGAPGPRPGPAPPAGARPRRRPSGPRPSARPAARRSRRGSPGIAPVYDVDGPRIRLGLAWFAAAAAGTAISPLTAAIVYGVAAGLAARQVVRAWGSVPWQADMAAGLAALPVLAALAGTVPAIGSLALVVVVAGVAACAPDGARIPGLQGRVAAAGIVVVATLAGVAGAALVLVRSQSVTAALVLVLLVSLYEAGDYIVGSGASNFVEGPLAGATTAVVAGFPLTLILVEPFDVAGLPLLAFVAACCPLGQMVASAMLPRPGAPASALRRVDTLLVLAPLWAAASAAF